MKKLGILGVLVFLVALAFVPQGVVAVGNNTANLTIHAGVQHAIELTVNATATGDIYVEDATNSTLIDLEPGSTTQYTVGNLFVQSNFPKWNLAVYEDDGDGKMQNVSNSATLTSALQVKTVADGAWSGFTPGGPAVAAEGDLLTLSGSGTSMVISSQTPQTKDAGAKIPITVQQAVTYDDLALDGEGNTVDYSITLTFVAGKY